MGPEGSCAQEAVSTLAEVAPVACETLPDLLGGVAGTQTVTLVMTTSGSGTWGIDDVFVDPFRSR